MSTDEFLARASKTRKNRKQLDEKKDIEAPFCKYAKTKGCHPLKLILLRKKGFPDRTVLCPGGRLLFIEFKRPGETLMGPQIIVRRLLESLGFEYHVCDRPGMAEKLLDKFLEGKV